MAILKCKKCGAVFEYEYKAMSSLVHLGPYKMASCPSCGKSSFMNVYSSVKEPITWPSVEKQQTPANQPPMTEEELEKKRLEDSKYERS